MKPHSSHMMFAGIGMAVIIGIGAVAFALHPAPQVPLAQVPDAASAVAPATGVPAAAGDSPQTAAPAGPGPEAVTTATRILDAPASVAHGDGAGATTGAAAAPAAIAPKAAGAQHVARDNATADTGTRSAARVRPAVDLSDQPTAAAPASATVRSTSGDELVMPAATSRTAADTAEPATSTASAASDSRITSEVKTRFAADSNVQAVDVGVITTRGVVVLTGTLATQDAIEHVKDVAGTVQDVKSVDTSALKITST